MRTENKMMWRSEDIVAAVNGTLHGPAFFASSVGIDSRKSQAGALFVALKGERSNGHAFVHNALISGASGALVEQIPVDINSHSSIIVVHNTYKALEDLALVARNRTQAKIIAVTGSVGKTGTKEALRIALTGAGSVYATHGNLNNHIGLPLSLSNIPQDTDFGVFELGMNHAGEIAALTRMARPHITIITNVEAVHLEFFAHVEAIADAKAEIMESMQPDGTVILNRDNAYYGRLRDKAVALGIRNIITFGMHAEAHCRLVKYQLQDMGSQVEAIIQGTSIAYRLGTIGRHWAIISLAVLAAGMAAGADLANTAAALAHFYEPEGRGKLLRVQVLGGHATLIDDCYNASPASVAAALAKLAEIKHAQGAKGRAIAILGDMLELGNASPQLHAQLQEHVMRCGIDRVHLAGPLMRHLRDRLSTAQQGIYATSANALAPLIIPALQADDVVLIKGSRGSRMDIVRDALISASSSLKASEHAV